MATITPNTIIDTALTILNDSTKLADCLPSRTGSFFFGPDQEISFGRSMPKGQVMDSSVMFENKGFGQLWEKTKVFNIDIYFYSERGIIGSGTGSLKNRDLVQYYLGLIEDTLITNGSMFGNVRLNNFANIDKPIYVNEQGIYVGVISPIFIARV